MYITLATRYQDPGNKLTNATIGSDKVHPHVKIGDRDKAGFLGEEGMLLVGVDGLIGRLLGMSFGGGSGDDDGQIFQVIVVVDPGVQDGLNVLINANKIYRTLLSRA